MSFKWFDGVFPEMVPRDEMPQVDEADYPARHQGRREGQEGAPMDRVSGMKDRPKFRVVLELGDGSTSEHVLYAENTEHAVRKAEAQLPSDSSPVVGSQVHQVEGET